MVGAVKTDDLIMEEYYMELSMQYGYIRVSSKEQNEDRQYIAMSEFGIQNENIILDKQSGKNFERPGYIQLISKLCSSISFYWLLGKSIRRRDILSHPWKRYALL